MALTSIDVGAAAETRPANLEAGNTYVCKTNPANAAGYITQISIKSVGVTPLSGIQVGAFSAVGNDLTTTGYTSLANAQAGLTTYNAPVDFTPFAIASGGYIGIYYTGGRIYATNIGVHWLLLDGDYIPCTSETFSGSAWELSLYATGYDEIRGWINVGDVWKLIDTWQINIGDVWKNVSNIQQNIGDVWKSTWKT